MKLRRGEALPTNAVCPREQRGGTVTERSERLLCEARDRSSEDPPIHFDGWLRRSLPQRAPRLLRHFGRFDRQHRTVHDELAKPDFRFGEGPGKQATLVAVERGHRIAHELADVRRPAWGLRHPRREELSRTPRPHLLAHADVDKQLRQQLAVDDRRQGAMAHRHPESVDVLERELLHVGCVGADHTHAENNLEHVVHRQRVHTLVACPAKEVGGLLDATRNVLGHHGDERSPLGLPQKVPQPELGRDAMHAVRALRRGHLCREILEPLPVDDEQVARLGGSACLIQEATQE